MTASAPLSGIRVLDFTHAAAGPYLTMLLADLGAEVIKVERPGRGDGSRTMGEPMLGELNSDYFVSINRNKEDIVIDLGSPEGAELARRLAAESDVVVQNFRPGVMDRLGLGFEELRVLHPRLVYCSISAFGTSGPWAARPANDIIMQSVSGLMGLTGEVGGGPVKIGVPIADYGAGLFALSGILSALLARERHESGQHVEIAMLNTSLALAANFVPRVLTLGKKVPRMGRQHPQIVPYQAFECADGEYLMIGAFTSEFWRRLCVAVGHPEWQDDERFKRNAARLHNREVLVGKLSEIFAVRNRDHWLDMLGDADVPCSPVYGIEDALRSEQAVHNGVTHHLERDGQAVDLIASPIRSAQWQAVSPQLPPSLGQDSRAVLRRVLGMSDESVTEMVTSGVVHELTNEGEGSV